MTNRNTLGIVEWKHLALRHILTTVFPWNTRLSVRNGPPVIKYVIKSIGACVSYF